MDYFVSESEAFQPAAPEQFEDYTNQQQVLAYDNGQQQMVPYDNGAAVEGYQQQEYPQQEYRQQEYPNKRRFPRKPKKPAFMTTCELCDIKLNSHQQAENHFGGKIHAKKLKTKTETTAAVAAVTSVTSVTAVTAVSEPPAKKARVEDTDLHCNTCNMDFQHENMSTSHYQGRKHKNAINKLNGTGPPEQNLPFRCEVCDCSLTCRQNLDSHLAGRHHAKQLKKQQGGEEDVPVVDASVASEAVTDSQVSDETADTADGQVCEVMTARLGNGRANKASKQPKAQGKFACEVCNIFVNSEVQYKQHIDSKKHMDKLIQPNGDQQETPDHSNGQDCQIAEQENPDQSNGQECQIAQ